MSDGVRKYQVDVLPGGTIVLPEEVRKLVNARDGGRVTFLVDGDGVRVVNTNSFALKEVREALKGVAEKIGIRTDDDVVALVKEVRKEVAREKQAQYAHTD